jgi:hypothetical protein
MRARALMLLFLPALAVATLATPAATVATPSDSQAAFTKILQADPKTTSAIKGVLTGHEAIVDPRSGFVDVTGDDRQDALAVVTTGGALGTIGLYVLSTHGQDAGDQDTSLKVIFRLQTLRQATLRVSGTSLTVLEPVFAKGADLCCPTRLHERDYRFDAAHVTFQKVGDRRIAFG